MIQKKLNFREMPDKVPYNHGISVVIYSDPGVGKTTLASTLPPGETLIINTDAGLGPLYGTQHIVFDLNERLDDLDQLYKFLRVDDHPFKNVVVDNISELEQWVILQLCNMHGKENPELREYGNAGYKMRSTLRQFRDLTSKGINVVFNAWEMPMKIKDGDMGTVTRAVPKLFKKVAPELCGLVDVVGHLEVHEKSGKRWIRIGPSDQYVTKCQYKGLDQAEPADLPMLFEKLRSVNYAEEETKPKRKDKK